MNLLQLITLVFTLVILIVVMMVLLLTMINLCLALRVLFMRSICIKWVLVQLPGWTISSGSGDGITGNGLNSEIFWAASSADHHHHHHLFHFHWTVLLSLLCLAFSICAFLSFFGRSFSMLLSFAFLLLFSYVIEVGPFYL